MDEHDWNWVTGRRFRGAFLVLMTLAIYCVPMPLRAHAAVPSVAESGVLLGSSRDVRREFASVNVCRVAQTFAGLRIGSVRTSVSPEELQMMLGPKDPALVGVQDAPATGEPAATVEIETRAFPGIHETGAQARVPFGFRSIAWGLRHPTQAWRLLMPVLGDDSK